MEKDRNVWIKARVTENVRNRFKALCAMHGLKMEDVAFELIQTWIAEKDAQH